MLDIRSYYEICTKGAMNCALQITREDTKSLFDGQIRPLHVFLVEDNPGDVRLMREALRNGVYPETGCRRGR